MKFKPLYGVFVWREDGKYARDEAIKTYVLKSAAESYCARQFDSAAKREKNARHDLVARRLAYYPQTREEK